MKRKQGFASLDPEQRREIAGMGGRAAHASGTAHEFTSEEARIAGRKGGEAVSRDRAHMSEIGKRGGQVRAEKQFKKDLKNGKVFDPTSCLLSD